MNGEQEQEDARATHEDLALIPERESKEETLNLVTRLRRHVTHGGFIVPAKVLQSLDLSFDYVRD